MRRAGVLTVLLVAACSSGDDAVSDDAGLERTPATSDAAATAPAVTAPPPVVDGPLADVCPDEIVIQTTGPPAPQVGALYLLLDTEREIADGVVSAPLVRADGTVEDVRLEIRSGGPATGFRDAIDVAADDPAITLVHTSVSAILERFASVPNVAVAALTDRSRQAIVVDPATHPDVSGVNAVVDAGLEVRHFTGSAPFAFLAADGVLDPALLVDGFAGGPAGFVAAEGAVAQQGDLLVDPPLFAALPQWDRPVNAIALSSAGWDDHDDVLAVPAESLDELAPCLERLVPVVQEAIVAYAEEPTAANEAMAAKRITFDPLSRITPDILDAAAAIALEVGVVGNGANETVGDVDIDRLDGFLAELADVLGIDVVSAEDLATNRFIDPTIGL